MPRMDGWEALDEHEEFQNIPTVVLTTSEADQDVLYMGFEIACTYNN